MARTTKRLTAICVIAAATIPFTPAQAVNGASGLPSLNSDAVEADFSIGGRSDASRYDTEAHTSNWRGRHWRGRGWRGRGWHRHRRGVSAGDVLAGVAIIGGIAAIASAASRNDRDRRYERYRYDDRYERDREWQQDREIEELRRRTEEQERELDYLRSRGVSVDELPPSASRSPLRERYGAPIDIDTAIDRCVEVIEIDASVSEIDGVDRTGSGWNVTGRIEGGEAFTCRISREGQIEALENGRGLYDYRSQAGERQPAKGQWSRADYADARAALRASAGAERTPAYPGGPLPGEDVGG